MVVFRPGLFVAARAFAKEQIAYNIKQSRCSYSTAHKYREFLERRKMEAQAIARPDPVLMKIDSPEFHSIFTPELKDLIALFKRYNYEIRIAGGAVRDILMNINPKDVDIATTATPTQMKEIFTTEKIRMVNMNGEKHGTITPRINDKECFEVTTLRVDVVTDGRHAEVVHTTDWLLDANRRDLTINSMFLGFDGTLYDYFYGYEDLQKRRVAFVGDPDTRIKEDYLRILRYFRFYGRIAECANRHDAETLRIITNNATGLAKISGERIWQEWKKILTGNFGTELTTEMIKCDLAVHCGLPESPNVDEFVRVSENVRAFAGKLEPMTLVAALLHTQDDAIKLNSRLRLTVFERELIYFITQNREEAATIEEILPFQQLCLRTIGNAKLKKEYVLELLKYLGKRDLHRQLFEWPLPVFPVKGNVLIANGAPKGPKLGLVMDRLKVIWSINEYNMSEEEILKHLPAVLEEMNKSK